MKHTKLCLGHIFIVSDVLGFPYLDISGGILKPTFAGSNQASGQLPDKLVSDDLDSSLANLVGSESDACALQLRK